MKNIRPVGQITEDMEKLILELTDGHEMQWHEVLGLVHAYLQAHCPDSQELYEDGTTPVFFYGPKD